MGKKMETVTDFILGGSKIPADGDCSHEMKRHLLLGRKVMTNIDSILKSRDITLSAKVCLVKAMVFSSGHVWMWELDYKENWSSKNWCFWIVVLEKTLERVPWTARRSNQSILKEIILKEIRVFIGRTDAEAETPILWQPDVKSRLIRKDLDAGKDWRQEEKGTIEDEMAGWHHWLNGHKFGWTPGVGDGQGCISWGRKESDMTQRLNWTEYLQECKVSIFTNCTSEKMKIK